MAQLQKQMRRAAREDTRTKTVKLESFNPVVKPGIEIVIASTFGNMEATTHVVVTTRRKT